MLMKKIMFMKILVVLLLISLTGCSKTPNYVEEYRESKEVIVTEDGEPYSEVPESIKDTEFEEKICKRGNEDDYDNLYDFFSVLNIDFRYTKVCFTIVFDCLDKCYECVDFYVQVKEGVQKVSLVGVESQSSYRVVLDTKSDWFSLKSVSTTGKECKLSKYRDFDAMISLRGVNTLKYCYKGTVIIYGLNGVITDVLELNGIGTCIVSDNAKQYRVVRR